MYINDMKRVLRHCGLNVFADDTVLFIAARDIDSAIRHLNEDLESLCHWLKFKQLKLNVGKTKYMIISSRTFQGDCHISIDNERIDRVNEIKYLGVVIDDKLKFNSHINTVIKKNGEKIWDYVPFEE